MRLTKKEAATWERLRGVAVEVLAGDDPRLAAMTATAMMRSKAGRKIVLDWLDNKPEILAGAILNNAKNYRALLEPFTP